MAIIEGRNLWCSMRTEPVPSSSLPYLRNGSTLVHSQKALSNPGHLHFLCHFQNPNPLWIIVHCIISKLYLKFGPFIPHPYNLHSNPNHQSPCFQLILLPFLPSSNPFPMNCQSGCLRVEIRLWLSLLQTLSAISLLLGHNIHLHHGLSTPPLRMCWAHFLISSEMLRPWRRWLLCLP